MSELGLFRWFLKNDFWFYDLGGLAKKIIEVVIDDAYFVVLGRNIR